ncbi:hypothetical protein [Dactylosporangium sp. NPDC051541]|uniref:hypothetical protein n=1 Tax=Dactylosporangium sp. NPDC051541 TaxID=3363977 RepID=UPI0037A3F95D
MTIGVFQSVNQLPPTLLAGTLEAAILDPGGNPPQVIKAGDNWQVEVKWKLTGLLVPMLAGDWNLQLNIDQLGGTNDQQWPATPIVVSLTPANGTYVQAVNGPLNLIAAPGAHTFHVVVTLTYTTAAGTPGLLAGFVDCGIIQVFVA